jgi:pantetheine-phosphate adenylyltransferase
MPTRALYAGSFDPITFGHVDLIKRSAAIFDHVVVAVGHNPEKPGLFSIDERLKMIRESCKSVKNFSVTSYTGLTADFARRQKCGVLVRGLRDSRDFCSEMQMAHMNHRLQESIETIFLPGLQQFSNVSSSLMKEVVSLGGDISGLVPPIVEKALRKKMRE